MLGYVALAVLLLVFFAGLALLQARRLDAVDAHVAAVAAEREGWAYDGTCLSGPAGDVTIAAHRIDDVHASWSVQVQTPTPWARDVRVARRAIGRRQRRRSDDDPRDAIPTGDRDFDATVHVEGDRRQAVAALPSDTRLLVRRAVAQGFVYKDGQWVLHDSMPGSKEGVDAVLRLAAELGALPRVHDVDAELAERLRRTHDPALLGPLLAAWFAGARHLPDGVQERLIQLLEGDAPPDARWPVLDALWLRVDDALILPALAGFVRHPSWGETAIRRLADRGTLAEVPALLAVVEAVGPHVGPAERALEFIRWRHGGEAGQLSIAEDDPGAGALSVAERAERGQLSRVPEG